MKIPNSTSWAVTGLGAAVSLLGYGLKPKKSKVAAGVVGFGLAHVALGLLDNLRPVVKDEEEA